MAIRDSRVSTGMSSTFPLKKKNKPPTSVTIEHSSCNQQLKRGNKIEFSVYFPPEIGQNGHGPCFDVAIRFGEFFECPLVRWVVHRNSHGRCFALGRRMEVRAFRIKDTLLYTLLGTRKIHFALQRPKSATCPTILRDNCAENSIKSQQDRNTSQQSFIAPSQGVGGRMGKNGTEGRKSSNQEADSPVDVNCQPAFPPPFAFFLN